MSSTFRTSIWSHAAAIALGAIVAAALLSTYPAKPQSLAAYVSAICAKSFGSASSAEAPYLADNVSAMTKMLIDMGMFEVVQTRGHIEKGSVRHYQVTLRVGFTLEE